MEKEKNYEFLKDFYINTSYKKRLPDALFYFTMEKMKKNIYYKKDDLKKAWEIAHEIINGNKKYKLIKRGNKKLSKNTLIFDMPSIITCKHACRDCYALKSERMYKNTRIMRLYHFLLVEYARIETSFIKKVIIEEIEKNIFLMKKRGVDIIPVRVHASGDFYSKNYLELWLDIIDFFKNEKSMKFYTYTKFLNENEIDEINKKYDNFNIIKSIFSIENKNYLNYGKIERIEKIQSLLNKKNIDNVLCSYGITDNNSCMSTCHACLNCSYVLFKQH